MSLEEQLMGMHVGRENGLVATLLRESCVQFAGRYIRSTSANKQIVREVALPRWVVPMCAEFKKPYTDDFIHGLGDAVDYIQSSHKVNFDQKDKDNRIPSNNMILIPIDSPGGNTDLLRQILTYIETIRGVGTATNDIKIVTYGFNLVASCAFVLYQGGDVCIASDNADFMCHEPAIWSKGGTKVQNYNQADRTAHSLHELKTRIYGSAECHLYNRSRTQNETLQQWRARWFEEHSQDGSIVTFAKSVREYKENSPPPFAIELYGIFDYLVKEVATNVSDQIIVESWMLKLGLCDAAGVDVSMGTIETISLHKLPTFDCEQY